MHTRACESECPLCEMLLLFCRGMVLVVEMGVIAVWFTRDGLKRYQ